MPTTFEAKIRINEANETTDILLEPLVTNQQINLGEYPESNCERVRCFARKYDHDERQLFCEMLALCRNDQEDDNYCWFEQARWIKYEETVEGSRQRWSKPHIPLLSLHSLLQLKNCLLRGVVLLDVQARTFPQLVDRIVKEWEENHFLDNSNVDNIHALLLCNKEHVTRTKGIKAKLSNVFSRKISDSRRNSDQDVSQTSADEVDTENESPEADATKISMQSLNLELSKKLSENAEVAVILYGRCDLVENSLCAFARLDEPKYFSNLSEVNRKVRFVFVLIANEDLDLELSSVGRALAAALIDQVFIHVAYDAQDPVDLCYAIDEYMCSMLIIPPGKWDASTRLEPSEGNIGARQPNRSRIMKRRSVHDRRRSSHDAHFAGLQFSGKIFGGLRDDLKRKMPSYLSDFFDAVSSPNAISQCTAASLFLFFANLTNIITFGGVMGGMLKNEMAVIECITSGFVSGIVFGLFSGQPMNILSATGPVLIFETLFYKFCKNFGWAFLPARFWLGFWCAVQTLVLVVFDASFLVAYITRFTEECFATLISVIFIVESFQAMFNLATLTPITPDPLTVINDTCRCNLADENGTVIGSLFNISTSEDCLSLNGTLVGRMCNFHPDVFMFSLLLFFGTFALASSLSSFKNSRFFPSKVRAVISDFAVFLSISIMTLLNFLVGLNVKTLDVPTEFHPTLKRSWLVDVTDIYSWWVALACFLPALLLTVLIVMDQQITAVIVNRKDNKLKKGFGYHLDLFVITGLIIICSLFGLPFFVAATILSITHVQSLRMESECAAPGERPLFLGVREQRITTIVAHVLIGLSIFLAPVQRQIPLAVLLGVFLYMGVSCLTNQQFVQRLLLFFTPVKYQPDFSYLRVVPLKRVYLFTGIQLAAFVLLCAVKYSKAISMLFPILLIVLVGVRMSLDRLFIQQELSAMDDVLPLKSKLMKSKLVAIDAKRRDHLLSVSSTNDPQVEKLA